MKKIILGLLLISVLPVLAICQTWNPFGGSNGKIVNVTVSSTTSTQIFTDQECDRLQVDNQCGFTVLLSTFQITPGLSINVTNYYLMSYPIASSTNVLKPIPTFINSNFSWLISTCTVPSGTRGIWAIIEK